MAYISGSITEESKIIVLDSNHNKIVSKDFTPDSYTKLLLHFDESTLLDSCATPKTLTLNGGIARSATQNKFGGYSGYFNGGYISINDSLDWEFEGQDFTIDFWLRTSSITNQVVLGVANTTPATNGWRIGADTVEFYIQSFKTAGDPNGTYLGTSKSNVEGSSFKHIAFVRNGSRLDLYINGVSVANLTKNTEWSNPSNPLQIGRWQPGNVLSNTYIDELRISKGIARWTTNFTPPTQAYKTPAPFMYNINGADRYTYSINNLTSTSGTIIAMSNLGEVVGYNNVTFVPSVLDITGGTITTNGNYRIHTFTSAGTFYTPVAGLIDYIVVGAGGGGGGNRFAYACRAAGGGGKVIQVLNSNISLGTYSIVIGTGGAYVEAGTGGTGGTSSFNSTSAVGGSGAYQTGHGGASGSGMSGATGGGASYVGGGGGGDSAASPGGSNGGNGTASSLSGSSVYYGGGGFGQYGYYCNVYGVAGLGGGGTSYGGGGSIDVVGGAGGSGIVIIRYLV